MGMYNEVFDQCPQCGGRGYTQIGQVVLGFGGFNIDDLADLKRRYDRGDLSKSELNELADKIEDEILRCGAEHDDGNGCGHAWRIDRAKILAIRMLADVGNDNTEERAIELLKEAGIIR